MHSSPHSPSCKKALLPLARGWSCFSPASGCGGLSGLGLGFLGYLTRTCAVHPFLDFRIKPFTYCFAPTTTGLILGGSFETDPPPKGSGPGKQWCGRVGSWQAMVAEVSRKFPMRWLLLSLIFFVLHNTWWLHNTALNLTWMCDSQFVGTSFHSATFW